MSNSTPKKAGKRRFFLVAEGSLLAARIDAGLAACRQANEQAKALVIKLGGSNVCGNFNPFDFRSDGIDVVVFKAEQAPRGWRRFKAVPVRGLREGEIPCVPSKNTKLGRAMASRLKEVKVAKDMGLFNEFPGGHCASFFRDGKHRLGFSSVGIIHEHKIVAQYATGKPEDDDKPLPDGVTELPNWQYEKLCETGEL